MQTVKEHQEKERRKGMPAVSVIVPVYNGGSYLQECIDSILHQTFSDLELVLVDDGSTDGSGLVCDEAAEKDRRVRVIHKENEGLLATWIRGVRESRAAFVAFIDCDDWLSCDHLEKMTAQLEEIDSGISCADGQNAGRESGECTCAKSAAENPQTLRWKKGQVVCGGYVIEREWNHTSENKKSVARPGVYEGERLKREIQDKLLGNEDRTLILSRCMKLFSKELILDNLHFCDPQIRMGEDVTITVPALLDAGRIVVLEDNYDYHYRFVHSSMVHGYDSGMYENIQNLRRILLQEMAEKKVPNGAMQVEREFLFLFCLVLKNELRRTGVPAEEVITSVQRMCREMDTQARVKKMPAPFRDTANRLLALVMVRPSELRIRIVRRIFLQQAAAAAK